VAAAGAAAVAAAGFCPKRSGGAGVDDVAGVVVAPPKENLGAESVPEALLASVGAAAAEEGVAPKPANVLSALPLEVSGAAEAGAEEVSAADFCPKMLPKDGAGVAAGAAVVVGVDTPFAPKKFGGAVDVVPLSPPTCDEASCPPLALFNEEPKKLGMPEPVVFRLGAAVVVVAGAEDAAVAAGLEKKLAPPRGAPVAGLGGGAKKLGVAAVGAAALDEPSAAAEEAAGALNWNPPVAGAGVVPAALVVVEDPTALSSAEEDSLDDPAVWNRLVLEIGDAKLTVFFGEAEGSAAVADEEGALSDMRPKREVTGTASAGGGRAGRSTAGALNVGAFAATAAVEEPVAAAEAGGALAVAFAPESPPPPPNLNPAGNKIFGAWIFFNSSAVTSSSPFPSSSSSSSSSTPNRPPPLPLPPAVFSCRRNFFSVRARSVDVDAPPGRAEVSDRTWKASGLGAFGLGAGVGAADFGSSDVGTGASADGVDATDVSFDVVTAAGGALEAADFADGGAFSLAEAGSTLGALTFLGRNVRLDPLLGCSCSLSSSTAAISASAEGSRVARPLRLAGTSSFTGSASFSSSASSPSISISASSSSFCTFFDDDEVPPSPSLARTAAN